MLPLSTKSPPGEMCSGFNTGGGGTRTGRIGTLGVATGMAAAGTRFLRLGRLGLPDEDLDRVEEDLPSSSLELELYESDSSAEGDKT